MGISVVVAGIPRNIYSPMTFWDLAAFRGSVEMGEIVLPENGGKIRIIDIPVTSDAPAGTIEGYVFAVDAENLVEVLAESDGAGGIRKKKIFLRGENLAGVYGDGSDGDVTISADTSLSRDMFYRNLTINSGVRLDPNGYIIFVKEKLVNNGTISRAGNDGTDGSPGSGGTGGSGGSEGTGLPQGSLGSSASGGIGGAGANVGGTAVAGSVGIGASPSLGGNGGAGGSGGNAGASGGAGGVATEPAASVGGFRALPLALLHKDVLNDVRLLGGAGGGGGGGGEDDGTYAGGGGGGGGSGGGPLVIAAKVLENNGTITAKGGNGGAGGAAEGGTAGAGGQGGGGGGGDILLVYHEKKGSGTVTADGGTGATAGSPGKIIEIEN